MHRSILLGMRGFVPLRISGVKFTNAAETVRRPGHKPKYAVLTKQMGVFQRELNQKRRDNKRNYAHELYKYVHGRA